MNAVDVGKFISELRKENGFTQKELAEKLSVTDKAVSKWETGKCYPDIETIEKISKIFNISINEILKGKKILPEKTQEEADKTIIQVMKNSKKEKHKGQIVALVLAVITLISGLFAVYQAIKSPNNEHISLQLYSKNRSSVFNEISAAIYKEFYISSDTVCTDSYIRYDENGEVTYIDMQLLDNDTFKRVSVKYWINDETGTPETSITMFQNENYLSVDGICFDKYINFLSAEDIGKVVEMSGCTTDFGYAINSDSSFYKITEENAVHEINPENQNYLYQNGDIVNFTNAVQIEGNLFEISVFANIQNNSESDSSGSCAIINFPK